MRYDFFAAEQDKIDLLDFIFNQTDLNVLDLSSPYGEETNQYKTSAEIAAKFDLQDGKKFAHQFQLWSPRFNVGPYFRKVEVNPEIFDGHTFRYSTEGWGLIQLSFGSITENIVHSSRIAHHTYKRALSLEGGYKYLGLVNQWDWREVEKTSARLKYHLHHRLAVKKHGAKGLLKGAEVLLNEGLRLF